MAETNNGDRSSMEQRRQRQRQLRQQQLFLQQHRQQLFFMQQQLQQQQQPQASIHHQPSYNLHQPLQCIIPHFLSYDLRATGVRPFQAPPQRLPPPSSSSSHPPPVPCLRPHHVPPQSQPARPAASGAEVGVGSKRPVNPVEIEMAHQDALMVCNPDYKSPFASVEDAVHRLLPYHVVSDYNTEEDDRVLESDTTGDITSRSQQWDNDALDAVTKFNATFEKQVRNFNMMLRKRAQGEFRSEERLMLENALMQEEKEALLKTKLEIESREKADKEAAEAQMRMAMSQGEQAQAELRSHANVYAASLRYEGYGDLGGNMDGLHGWNYSKRDEESSEDSSE
ncbi:hypothetical protein MUK42_01873 [Musa troglodytarum]|uniref:GLTSCR protein conserved domain-containing protein n=1 Tax=Musa troglodytarum TaxID=320322 RepID=A0A9E7FAB3_9LILI|nr:hypothetical protein MUK42_01873 [Musa troglodytarum]